MVRPSRRGGVPVFKRPSGSPRPSILLAKFMQAFSPARPPDLASSPILITPRRNVPVVSTTERERILVPSATSTPHAMPRSTRMSATSPSTTVNLGVAAISACIACRYSMRSIWALGPCTAGPFDLFSNRNWMPALSAMRPITPSSASISRTSCPLPTPPTAGLHDMVPIASALSVTSAVCAPALAEAHAASQPACPPPTTTTSKCFT